MLFQSNKLRISDVFSPERHRSGLISAMARINANRYTIHHYTSFSQDDSFIDNTTGQKKLYWLLIHRYL